MINQISKKRISYIDMAKGIGIILVVIGHTEFTSPNLITWISSFHMPLFFIISGILFAHTKVFQKDGKTFICNKLKTILVPYAFFSVISIIASAILDYDSFPEDLVISLLQTVSFNGIAVLWFLPALFLSEAIFFRLTKHTSSRIIIVSVLEISVFSIIGNELYHRFYTITGEYLNLLISYMITVMIRTGIAISFLAIGYYAYRLFLVKILQRGIYWILAGASLALNLCIGLSNCRVDLNQLVLGNYILYYLAAFFGSMCVICICRALPYIRPLIYVGENSLIIMVTHGNCRFLGICYAIGRLAVSALPILGKIGYIVIVIIVMIGLEVIAITLINRYMPFLIGRNKKIIKKVEIGKRNVL